MIFKQILKQNNLFKKSMAIGLFVIAVFVLIGMSAYADSEEVKVGKYDIQQISAEKDFALTEAPEFEFQIKRNGNFLMQAVYWIEGLFVDVYKNKDIKAYLKDSTGRIVSEVKPEMVYEKKGIFYVKLPQVKNSFRPGQYKFIIAIGEKNSSVIKETDVKQDFSWGVLAINSNKSLYLSNETAYLQMAVLDNAGDTVCNAVTTLEITDPTGQTQALSTENSLITRSKSCSGNNKSDEPDYFGYYKLDGVGKYKIKFTAKTPNGEKLIYDYLEVREKLPFEIERVGPTRIYPRADYQMKIKVRANEDFSGDITEVVPEGFKIIKQQTTDNTQQDSNFGNWKFEIGNSKDEQKLIWKNLKLKAGQEIILKYSFDAPDISPAFYMLGPLQVGKFVEARKWQIASDALETRANTVQFIAGTWSSDGNQANGQNSDTNQTLPSFNFRLGENGVTIKNAFIVFEAQFEAYVNNNVNYTGYSLYFDSCQAPCTPNAITGTSSVTKTDATVLAYDETNNSNQVRLLFDVTSEAQLAAYGGTSTLMSGQVGYTINKAAASVSIANAKATLHITYTYNPSTTENYTKTVIYPLESIDSSRGGTKATTTSDACILNSTCPLFGYNMTLSDYSVASSSQQSQWFTMYNTNDRAAAAGTDIKNTVNIQGNETESSAYWLESNANKTEQSVMPAMLFSGVAGYAENTNQTLEYRATSTGAPSYYLQGGEVTETYIASSSFATKTRTVVFPLGVIVDNPGAAGTSTATTTVYFPENGSATGTVRIKKAWVRLITSNNTTAVNNTGISTKVGGTSLSAFKAYAYNPGVAATIAKTSFNIIHVISSTSYSELEKANATNGVPVGVYSYRSTAAQGGVSAVLMITYDYTDERNGYLTSLSLYGGQSAVNPGVAVGLGQSTTTPTANSVLPETLGTKTIRAAAINASYLAQDSDGNVGTTFTVDTQLSTNTPSCTVGGIYRADISSINGFVEHYKNVTSAMNTTNNQAYNACYTNSGPSGDTSGGAKMNGILFYTYSWDNKAPTSTFLSIAQQANGLKLADISFQAWDQDRQDLRAKLEYDAGADCDFAATSTPTISTNNASTTASTGDPQIDNGFPYQIGTSSGYILTTSGSNNVNTTWEAGTDLYNVEGTYCLKLTVNDFYLNQATSATSTIYIDTKNPTAPGNLSLNAKTGSTLIINFGATTTENNFKEYKIYYKVDNGIPVNESDSVLASSTDPHLGDKFFSNFSTTTIPGLQPNTIYNINIFAYDNYGNRASATPVSFETSRRPLGEFFTVSRKFNSSGIIDISIKVGDYDSDPSRAQIQYVAGAECNFSSPNYPTLDETDDTATSTYDDAKVDSDFHNYQIGTTTGWISTNIATNTVSFDWNSMSDIPTANGTYCLRLTANDQYYDQATSATTTIFIDNVAPVISTVYLQNGMFKIGNQNTVIVFADAIGYTLSPNATINTVNSLSNFTDVGDNSYTFVYTVNEGDPDRISGTNPVPISVVFRDSKGNENVPFTTPESNTASIDAHKPIITLIEIPSIAYKVGDTIRATATVATDLFTETYTLDAASRFNLQSVSNLQKFDSTHYTFDYIVENGHANQPIGNNIPVSLVLTDGRLQSNTAYTALAPNTASIDANKPIISALNFSKTSGYLKIGETVTATATSDGIGYDAGIITINGKDVAVSLHDNGDNTYLITYTVAEGDDYIDDSLNLPVSITLIDDAGNYSDSYTNASAGTRPGVDATRPTISSVVFTPDSGYLKIGDTATATIQSNSVGSTAGTITINGKNVAASLHDNGDNSYRITYTVAESDNYIDDGSDLPVVINLIDNHGNTSLTYNTADIGGRPGVDAVLPTAPTALSLNDKSNNYLILNFGTPSTEDHFIEYKIFYRLGTSGVTENDDFISSSTDPSLGDRLFKSNATTTIFNLASSTPYVFAIWVYDIAGNKASSTEFTVTTNSAPSNPVSLGQFKIDEITAIANGEWDTEDEVRLKSSATDPDETSLIALYYELKQNGGSFTTATSEPNGACTYGADYDTCTSKIWFVAPGSAGDYRIAPFVSTTSITIIPDDVNGYKWQVIACDEDGACSDWVDAGADPNFKVDHTPPTAPGDLSFSHVGDMNIRINFGATTTEDNFLRYRIFFKQGSSGVGENDDEHSDDDLLNKYFNYTSSTTVINLSSETPYVFNIWVYDLAGNKSFATEISTTTLPSSYEPDGYFNTIGQRTDGTGNVAVSIEAGDFDHNNLSAKIEYESGSDCDFAPPAKATINEANEKTSADIGDPKVDNGSDFQIGTTSGWIMTSATNTVLFDWQSRFDLPDVEGTYCLRMTLNDGILDQLVPATTTVEIDNIDPTNPGGLSLNQKSTYSITLNLGATSSDSHFDRYRIFYKEGDSGVTENDSEKIDENLDDQYFKGQSTTTVSGLKSGTEYVFNIWAYDIYGNKASGTQRAITTNHIPAYPASLNQYKNNGITLITNTGWTNENNIKLKALANDGDTAEIVTLYFEMLENAGTFRTATSVPMDGCAFNAAYNSCDSKIWQIASASGDYSITPFTGTVNPSAIPNSATGYKWQVIACDDSGVCSDWSDAGADPNFKIDYIAPTLPGHLSVYSRTATTVIMNLGATTTEDNFKEYKIFYKAGSAGVAETDSVHASNTDANLGVKEFNGSTTITGLSVGVQYVFNIWAYDEAGNKASSSQETTVTMNTPPTGAFVSAGQKIDGSNVVDISINVNDANQENCKAKLEYVLGADCNFTGLVNDPTFDTNDSTATSSQLDAKVDNANEYQIGNNSGWIVTTDGLNNVNFDWLAGVDLLSGDDTYCLRLTVSDGFDIQTILATTTLTIDNVAPTAPGDLTLNSANSSSITLNFGTTTTETNFKEYKIFYKEGITLVTEADQNHADSNLSNKFFNTKSTTTVFGLNANAQYSFRIYAYDNFGHKTFSGQTTYSTNAVPNAIFNSAAQKTDGSGTVDLSMQVYDPNLGNVRVRVDYVSGDTCNFDPPLNPSLDENIANIQSGYGVPPLIDNNFPYQVGTSSNWIITSSGANNVNFDWLSKSNIGEVDGTYCLRLIANDGSDDQAVISTTTITIDNVKPTIPGNLSIYSVTATSVIINLGATTTEDNFFQYKIFYRVGTAGVAESDSEFNKTKDANLGYYDFRGAGSTTIGNLTDLSDYVFNIWAYDIFGNKASATIEVATTTLEIGSANWREAEDIVDPTGVDALSRFQPFRLRLEFANLGDYTASNYQYRLEYGQKESDCTSVASWTPVPVSASSEDFQMVDSYYIYAGSSTTARLQNNESHSFVPGYVVEKNTNKSDNIILAGNEYTEVEYAIEAATSSQAGQTYCFRATNNGQELDAYEKFPEITLSPPATSTFYSLAQRIDGSGIVDLMIGVSHPSRINTMVKVEYVVGDSCDFSYPLRPTLDETPDNLSADFGNPTLNNLSPYQIGTTSAMIPTINGENKVYFDWKSIMDVPNSYTTYCLRLTANDNFDDQFSPATTTFVVDNLAPTNPGNLTAPERTDTSLYLKFGATSSDPNFKEYKIFYKKSEPGVTESDTLISSSTVPDLGYYDFRDATSTLVANLDRNAQYYFRIWAYDNFGNKSSSNQELMVKLIPPIRGKIYSDNGINPLLTGPKVSIAVNGIYLNTVNASTNDGSFNFYDIDTPATGIPVVVYLDDSVEKGVTYTLHSGIGGIDGLDIYKNYVIVKHESAGPIGTPHLELYDGDQDPDIVASVTGVSLNVNSGYKLYVWPGKTFEAGSGDLTLGDVKIDGYFIAVGEQIITVAGGWDASSGAFQSASSTVKFTSTQSGNLIHASSSQFWSIEIDGIGGEWTISDPTIVNSTTTITHGRLIQGADINFQTQSMTIENGAEFASSTGSGIFIFEGPLDGFFEDKNPTPNNLGNVWIGMSPAVTNLGSDFSAASLTINGGDTFNTRGYNVTITTFITNNGIYNCTDTKAGKQTTTSLGTNWTTAPSATFTSAYSTTNFNQATNGTLSAGGTDANHDFYHLTFTKTSRATTTIANYDVKALANLVIGANSVFDVSSSNYNLNIGGSWNNSGSFWARQATTTFDATSTGRTITPGDSSFYNIEFKNSAGGWTISGNATSTNDWTIASATALTINANLFIEVKGKYKISDSIPNITTWNTGSVLYLNNSANYLVGSKNQNAESYYKLKIGVNTDIRTWNSTSTIYEVDQTGSLYSMDHNNTNGNLYIWGDYHNGSGADYWSAATDFDGASLTGSERQVNVKLAQNATTTVDGGTLNIVGTSTASTTIDFQSAGNFAFEVSAGSLNAKYYKIRNQNTNGLKISGTPIISSLDYGDYLLAINGGSMIKIASSVIGVNPFATTTGCIFATSTGVSSGYNVNLSGTPSKPWTFVSSTGNLAGENYDNDPGDPRGYILWDDSPSYTPKSQDWRWYHDENHEKPISPAAATNTAPLIIGPNNTLKLRTTLNEIAGIPAANVKMRLQYSTYSDFSQNTHFVGEIASTTAAWNYGDGIDSDNDPIISRLLSDSLSNATHNESGTSTSVLSHFANDAMEWEFTLHNNNGEDNTVYYFRPYANYYSVYSTYEKIVSTNDGESYPSVTVSTSTLSFSIFGLDTGTVTEGVTTNISTSPTQVSFGSLAFDSQMAGAQRFEISTNAEYGYQLFTYERHEMKSNNGSSIYPIAGTNEVPTMGWSIDPNPSGFGYHTGDDTLSGSSPSRFSPDNSYAKFEQGLKEISFSPIPVQKEQFDLVYKIQSTNMQEAGDYDTEIVFIAVPTY